jgi:hypothetical protein
MRCSEAPNRPGRREGRLACGGLAEANAEERGDGGAHDYRPFPVASIAADHRMLSRGQVPAGELVSRFYVRIPCSTPVRTSEPKDTSSSMIQVALI